MGGDGGKEREGERGTCSTVTTATGAHTHTPVLYFLSVVWIRSFVPACGPGYFFSQGGMKLMAWHCVRVPCVLVVVSALFPNAAFPIVMCPLLSYSPLPGADRGQQRAKSQGGGVRQSSGVISFLCTSAFTMGGKPLLALNWLEASIHSLT